jgi:hypothetical protein
MRPSVSPSLFLQELQRCQVEKLSITFGTFVIEALVLLYFGVQLSGSFDPGRRKP